MTGPANSTTTSNGSREYQWPPGADNPERFPSVTTILGDGVPKKALIYWATTSCANFVLDNMPLVQHALNAANGRKVAYDMIRQSPWQQRDTAADMGTTVHHYLEQRAAGQTASDALLALELDQIDTARFEMFRQNCELFLDDWQPEMVRSEFTVYNRKHGYAGTADLLCRIPGMGVVLADLKTSKKGRQGHGIYPEAALQMNAYAHAEFIGERNGTESPMPQVDTLLGINVRGDGYAVVRCELSDAAFRSFLYAAQVAAFVRDGAAWVSAPLAPPINEGTR